MFQLQSEILSQVFKDHVQLSWGKFLPDNSKLYVSSRLKITAKFKVHYLFYLHELKILWKFLLINNTNFRGANRWFFNTNLEISHGNIFSFLFLTLFSCFSDLLQRNIRIFDWAIRVSSVIRPIYCRSCHRGISIRCATPAVDPTTNHRPLPWRVE